METKFTPGPWHVVHKPWAGISGPHKMIGAPDNLTGIAAAFGDDVTEIDANARLIAAAPEMLEALIWISDFFQKNRVKDHPMLGLHVSDHVRKAIAKATGES